MTGPHATPRAIRLPVGEPIHTVSDLRHWVWRLLRIPPRALCGALLVDDDTPQSSIPCPLCGLLNHC